MLAAAAAATTKSGGTPAEARELADVAGAGRVVDDADHHEQRGLEHRVRAHHRHAGELGSLPPAPTIS